MEQHDAKIIADSLLAPAVFGEIFERHYDTVFRYAAVRVGAAHGEEVAAEVFLRAFASRHRFRSDAPSARPWLLGITANVLRNHFRKTGRGRRATATASGRESGVQMVWFADADSRVDAATTTTRLTAALRAMRSVDREVLLLYALADLTYQEVAEALRIPIGTVRSRLARARATLKNSIADLGESTGGRSEQKDDG